MQLVAYGAQDIYLTGNPQITFFKVVYRRHTNFSMEAIEQTLNGGVAVNGNSTVTISRNGDLVHKIYVTNAVASTTNGSGIISEVELEIGGQRIDRHYEEWNQIWNELSTDESKAIGLKSMVGDIGTAGSADGTGPLMTQYPLNFWFCRNPGLALPLIALQYHEVKLKFTWGSAATKGVTSDVKVICDYIYLDTDERRRFAQVSHEYLIEQLQKQSASGTGSSDKLNFNHPVKELIWTSQATGGYTTAKLKLNGHDRFAEQNAEYFQLRQPYDYHTAVPRQNLPSAAKRPLSLENYNLTTAATGITKDADGAAVSADIFCSINAQDGSDTTVDTTDDTSSSVVGGITLTGGTTLLLTSEQAASMTTLFPVGQQLVITPVTDVDGDCVGATSAGVAQDSTALLGKSFFSTITSSTALGDHGVTLGITIPTNGSGVTVTTITDSSDGSGGASDFATSASQYSVRLAAGVNEDSARTSQMTKKINVYSFGLKPEEHQPSGTCNFSRIDNAQLEWSGGLQPTSSENIYAANYNVLRIMSGMGGLAYSN